MAYHHVNKLVLQPIVAWDIGCVLKSVQNNIESVQYDMWGLGSDIVSMVQGRYFFHLDCNHRSNVHADTIHDTPFPLMFEKQQHTECMDRSNIRNNRYCKWKQKLLLPVLRKRYYPNPAFVSAKAKRNHNTEETSTTRITYIFAIHKNDESTEFKSVHLDRDGEKQHRHVTKKQNRNEHFFLNP